MHYYNCFHPCIHSYIHLPSIPLILHLYYTTYPRELGAQGILERVPTHHRAQLHTHSHTANNLEMPVSLQHTSLDWGTKPEETPEAQAEHGNVAHTGRERHRGGMPAPNPEGARQTCNPLRHPPPL